MQTCLIEVRATSKRFKQNLPNDDVPHGTWQMLHIALARDPL